MRSAGAPRSYVEVEDHGVVYSIRDYLILQYISPTSTLIPSLYLNIEVLDQRARTILRYMLLKSIPGNILCINLS